MPKPQGVIAQWPMLSGTPAGNPPPGHVLVYYKSSDGKLYTKNSAGVESESGAGGFSNAVTLDTTQTITGDKRFSSTQVPHPPITVSPDASPPSSPQMNDLWVVPDGSPASTPVNFAVGSTNPELAQGMWVQTGLGDNGEDFTIWIEDGTRHGT